MKNIFNRYRQCFGLPLLQSLLGLAVVVSLLVASLIEEHKDATAQARASVETISRVLEEHAAATIQKADLLAREVQRQVRPDDMRSLQEVSSKRAQELHVLMKSQLEAVPEAAVLHVTNAQGDHIYSSLDTVPRVNIADRYHFTRHKEDAAAGLVISPPLVSRTTGKWTLILTRRLNFDDGSFAGIVNVILDLEYFQRFYHTLDLGPHGLVALYDKELRLAARYPASEKGMGMAIQLAAKNAIDQGMKQATYHATSPLDGIERLTSFRRTGDIPLFVFAAIAKDDYLDEWHRHIWQFTLGAVVFGIVVVGFGLRQQRAAQQLRRAKEAAEAANIAKSRFLSSMSHELRTPMNAVLGFAQLMQFDKALADEHKEGVQYILKAGNHLLSLINQVLGLAQMESGGLSMSPQRLDLGKLIGECLALVRPLADEHEVQLSCNDTTDVTVWADKMLLKQALLNLLANGIKYNHKGGNVTLTVATTGNRISIRISDTGQGIAAERMAELFEPFNRLGIEGSNIEGTGIGLHITRRLIEMMGGTVKAESTLGRGSTFSVEFPLVGGGK